MATGQISTGQVIVGRLSKSVAGAVDVTLTANESTQYQTYEFTGAITANINVIFASLVDGLRIDVNNLTTGAFTLTVKGPTGTGVVVGSSKTAVLRCNGTNFVRVTADV